MYSKVFTVFIHNFALLVNGIYLSVLTQYMNAMGVFSSTQLQYTR